MARISDISNFLGGADNVSVVEILQGEQFLYHGNVAGARAVPTDITGWGIEATVEFYLATVSGAGESLSISDVSVNTALAARPLDVTVTDATAGQFVMGIPSDLYPNEIGSNISALVPLAVVFGKITDLQTTSPPATPFPNIAKFRHIIVIRRAP